METQSEDKSVRVPVRDMPVEEDLWQRYKAERGVWTEPMLAALEGGMKERKWYSLSDKVCADSTLELAWAKVLDNAGACGVDGITVERFAKDIQSRQPVVKRHLSEGTYQPKPVKRVWIPKPGSAEKRPLGIPTVVDRIVQTALKMVIEPIFESCFHPQSYGFRPGRGCKDGLREVWRLLKGGHEHVVEIDIRKFFDNISQDRLMKLVQERIADKKVLRLIKVFLEQGVMEGTELMKSETGTPQGGVISPLLANIYLDPLDWKMSEAGFKMVRYADDMVVMCRTAEEAQIALETISGWMEGNGLALNEEKSHVIDMTQHNSHFDFLGYRFKQTNNGLRKYPRPKSIQKLRQTIKPLTRRNSGKSLEEICQIITPILRGWYGYFKQAGRSDLQTIDSWVRGRLRGILRKRRGGRGRGRGSDHQRWPNRYFTELGLFSLKSAFETELASLRNGANC